MQPHNETNDNNCPGDFADTPHVRFIPGNHSTLMPSTDGP